MKWLQIMMGCVAICAGIAGDKAWAQGAADYPTKPVTVVFSVAAGGVNDQEARPYTREMAELLGQPFVLEFKPGAGTAIGNTYVARAAPDGYTLLVATGSFSVFPAVNKNPPFDTLRDFAPIAQMSQRSTLLLVNAKFPANNVREYVAYAKANPGKVNFATSGPGVTHLAAVWLAAATGTDVQIVPYKQASTKYGDLMAGRLDASPVSLVTALPMLKKGSVKAIAVLNDRRSKLMPDIPTVSEQGVAGFDYPSWLGFLAPAKTPQAIITKLNQNLVKVARMPEIARQLEPSGVVMLGTSPEEFRKAIASETARWKKIVADYNIPQEGVGD